MRMLPFRSPVASWLPNGLILRHRAPSFGARELESELLKLVMFEMGRFVLAIVFDEVEKLLPSYPGLTVEAVEHRALCPICFDRTCPASFELRENQISDEELQSSLIGEPACVVAAQRWSTRNRAPVFHSASRLEVEDMLSVGGELLVDPRGSVLKTNSVVLVLLQIRPELQIVQLDIRVQRVEAAAEEVKRIALRLNERIDQLEKELLYKRQGELALKNQLDLLHRQSPSVRRFTDRLIVCVSISSAVVAAERFEGSSRGSSEAVSFGRHPECHCCWS